MKQYCLIVISLLIIIPLVIQSSNPNREFRGAWIATIKNIDWPSVPGLPAEVQKSELRDLFNSLHEAGINAVLFQIRTECDAFYPSEMEPWSYWLTGKQAKPPSPFYDPLQFAIKLARQNGMEFHAWFNPFRVKADTAGYVPDSSHISIQKPQWIIQAEKYKFLNPGIPETREYVERVVLDVLKRYDIDGIHFDDYFYPYSGMIDEDKQTFFMYGKGFENIEDWRRDNVNIFIRNIYETIKAIKPHVKFGISPFGIWKNDIPKGIKGFSSYHQIYCDATYWLQEKIVDYIAPQIYWKMGGEQDYASLANWWSDQKGERHLYVGHALYKMDTGIDNWNVQDIKEQVKFNQQNQQINGSIYFRAKDIQNNLKGVADSLKNIYYSLPALIPQMPWIDSIPPPLFPFSLKAIPSVDGTFLMWENLNNNEIKYNVVYRCLNDSGQSKSTIKNILAILPASESFYIDTCAVPGKEYRYYITAADRLFNEGKVSNSAAAIFSQLEIIDERVKETRLFDFNSANNQLLFSMAKKDIVNISLFNQNGEKIFNLLNEELSPALYGIRVNINQLLPGKYFYKLTTPQFSKMNSLIISNTSQLLE